MNKMNKRYQRNRKLCDYWLTMYATTTNADWGFIPVPGKGGATTNYDATMTDSEIRRIIHKKGGNA